MDSLSGYMMEYRGEYQESPQPLPDDPLGLHCTRVQCKVENSKRFPNPMYPISQMTMCYYYFLNK
jgi:hypothetical protein